MVVATYALVLLRSVNYCVAAVGQLACSGDKKAPFYLYCRAKVPLKIWFLPSKKTEHL